ncbi:hypothetical protein V1260_15245 [Brachybacterium sp. J144]|uniref:hypothetical protein n=1 Tax=Brachybacterium sp. J144 TaxID=3116487 RepID=UPI002E786ED9|nr:hypothetical protein [Brachybacterium sp. J144]MEE1652136.1 hypothetical protein [Brachybacterium sp. J144]
MSRRGVAVLLVMAAIIGFALFAGRNGGERELGSTSRETPAAAASSATPTKEPELYATPSDQGEEAGQEAGHDDSLENAAADQKAKDGAAAAALATAEIWVQGKTLDQGEWNEQLLDTMAPVAHPAYDGRTWGYRVEATAVTGEPSIAQATMTTATVQIPTDAGSLTLTVTRSSGDSSWATTAISED